VRTLRRATTLLLTARRDWQGGFEPAILRRRIAENGVTPSEPADLMVSEPTASAIRLDLRDAT
jgi:hypothetical protein